MRGVGGHPDHGVGRQCKGGGRDLKEIVGIDPAQTRAGEHSLCLRSCGGEDRAHQGHDSTRGYQSADFVFNGLCHIDRLFQSGWKSSPGDVFGREKADQDQGGKPKPGLGVPGEIMPLSRGTFDVVPTTDRSNAQEGRDRDSGDGGECLGEFDAWSGRRLACAGGASKACRGTRRL